MNKLIAINRGISFFGIINLMNNEIFKNGGIGGGFYFNCDFKLQFV